jgi:hypothetical protein
MPNEKDQITFRGDKAIHGLIVLLLLGMGGNAVYTNTRTDDRFKGSDARAQAKELERELRQEIAEMRGEIRVLDKLVTAFATSGPQEVREALRRIENELLMERSRYPKFPTRSAKQ